MGKKKAKPIEPEEPVEVRIKLPLASDVAATLIKIVGLTYPRTMIGTPESSLWQDKEMVLLIDQRDRHKSPKAHRKYLEQRDNASAYVESLTTLAPNNVGLSPTEALAKQWAWMAKQMFDEHPDAVNYLETCLYVGEARERYVFYCARSEGQTPHALRKEAEARADAAEARAAAAEERVAATERAMQAMQDYGKLTWTPDEPVGESDA